MISRKVARKSFTNPVGPRWAARLGTGDGGNAIGRLPGTYYQAVAKETYPVNFVRPKS